MKLGYAMHVSDVEAAFPMLPFAPWLWPFLLFRHYREGCTVQRLFAHVCGDFGTRGMPGVFNVFFVHVVVNMGRFVGVLTLPMPIYVDDAGLIGAVCRAVAREMRGFQDWAGEVCGVDFKRIKDHSAAQVQYMLG